MNIFDLNKKELQNFLNKEFQNITSEELLKELIECGLDMKKLTF